MHAISRRLRDFESPLSGAPDIVFRISEPGSAPDLPAVGRPVYDSSVGEILYDDSEDRLYLQVCRDLRLVVSAASGEIEVFTSALTDERRWLVSHPLVTLSLIELFKRHGLYSLHAAGLAKEGHGLLLAGSSGAGKSTLTVALLQAGFDFLGDDMLFLDPSQSELNALGFPDEIDLAQQTGALIPAVQEIFRRPRLKGCPKWSFRVEELYPCVTRLACRPAALVLLRPGSSATSKLSVIPPDEALIDLAPNVLLTEAQASSAHFAAIADLIRSCPIYRLETGRDFERLAERLRELMNP